MALVLLSALALAACASPSSLPAGTDGSALSADAVVGIRVEGPATLLEAGGGRCWRVSYDDGHGEVESPLIAPEGYTDGYAVMADPSRPGENFAGTTLENADGEMQGFADSGVMVAAVYQDAGDESVAAVAEDCGFTGAVLVADDPYGVTVDPDGLDTAVWLCTDSTGTQEPGMVPNLENCEEIDA